MLRLSQLQNLREAIDRCPRAIIHRFIGPERVAVLLLLLPLGCGKPLEKADCESLLLHYVDLLAASDRPDANSLERLRFRQQARAKAALDPEFASCTTKVSRAKFECAMQAASTDDFERCLM